jgi:hypothetical protein
MDNIRFLHFLFGLRPISGVGKKKGFSLGQDKGAITTGKATKITDVFKTGEEDSIRLI